MEWIGPLEEEANLRAVLATLDHSPATHSAAY
jgi:hypothetical protein